MSGAARPGTDPDTGADTGTSASTGTGTAASTTAAARSRTAARTGRTGLRARWSRATRTAPGRLRLAGVFLVVLTLGSGALTGWQLDARARAADRVVSHSQPLSQAASDIRRSLADADATAATGFLLAGAEPKSVRERYEEDLATASRLIAEAAARTTASSPAQRWLAELNQQLPVYAGLVESARAGNRQGYPLGGAYLRYASEQMRGTLLPAAAALADTEEQQLADDFRAARSVPWAAYGLGTAVLLALVWVQLVLFRRTNRVFNPGLLGATAAVLAGLVWLTAAGLGAGGSLREGEEKGTAPLRAVNAARMDVLSARLAENLHLVARGSSTRYAELWTANTGRLTGAAGADGAGAAEGADRGDGTLAKALRLAPPEAAPRVREARQLFDEWTARHRAAAALELDKGDYQGALDATVTADGAKAGQTSDASFKATDAKLAQAAASELERFRSATDGTPGVLRGAAVAAGLLALAAAGCALRGLGRRLAEYR
ncbi:hypothetical protein ACWGB8_19145 [Kitasatospora sp. NPDC054939]